MIDDKNYELIIASNLIGDGIGHETWDIETDKLISGIFRAISDQRIDLYSEKITVPNELIEKSLEISN